MFICFVYCPIMDVFKLRLIAVFVCVRFGLLRDLLLWRKKRKFHRSAYFIIAFVRIRWFAHSVTVYMNVLNLGLALFLNNKNYVLLSVLCSQIMNIKFWIEARKYQSDLFLLLKFEYKWIENIMFMENIKFSERKSRDRAIPKWENVAGGVSGIRTRRRPLKPFWRDCALGKSLPIFPDKSRTQIFVRCK